MSSRILIFGAGAVGSTIGGMLAKAGEEVVLVGRDPHMKRIAAAGMKISGLWGDHQITGIKACTEIPRDFVPDWILLTTKSYSTRDAAQTLKQHFPQSIPVLHLQNGVGNAEILADILGWPRVISAMIIIGFQIPVAGRCVVTVQGDSIKIGRWDGALDQKVQDIVALFQKAQMPVEAVTNVATHLWGKVLYNASLNPLSAIMGVAYGQLLEPQPWTIITALMEEAYQVLQAEKQPLFWPDARTYLEHLRTVQVPSTFDHQASMFADLRHARRTEIESINGALCRLGVKHRIPTPVNNTLVHLVKGMEENAQKGILHPSMQEPDPSSPPLV